jgi:hypothetical protein
MQRVFAKAPAIMSSETDRIEGNFYASRTGFLKDYPYFSVDLPWKDDDQSIDLMALVVLDDVPAEVRRWHTIETYVQKLELIVSRHSMRFSVPTQKRLVSLAFGWLTRMALSRIGIALVYQKELLVL